MVLDMNVAFRSTSIVVFFGMIMVLTGCQQIPYDYPREASFAKPPVEDSQISKTLESWNEEGTDHRQSGYQPLGQGIDALGARLRLIEKAEETIDLQYFLAKPDYSGHLVAGKLLEAADRGVRVRFLIDDIFTSVKDEELTVLDQHPNIEVRLFNPLVRGFGRYASFLRDFKVANRRMHNKSFTVDNLVSIVGGRNIADEYYDIKQDVAFADFDMLCVGPICREISDSFDLYWNNELAIPLEAFRKDDRQVSRKVIEDETLASAMKIYSAAVNSEVLEHLRSGQSKLVPGKAKIVADPPEKLVNPKRSGMNVLIESVREAMEAAESEILIITPYFVPGRQGVEFLLQQRERGIDVRVITNSLASTNHGYVHGGYAPRRKALLEGGVKLNEAKADSGISRFTGEKQSLTLHTKLVIIDRELIVVGSLNMDPRSVILNTEIGLFLESPSIAGGISERFIKALPVHSYELDLDERGKVRWTYSNGEEFLQTGTEPGASMWRRFTSSLVTILPVEEQL
jgi:putative cardiolipin synthase